MLFRSVELLQADACVPPPPEPPARDSCGGEAPSEPPAAPSCERAWWAQLRSALNPLNDRAYEGYSALDDASIPELNASVAVPEARRPEQGRRSLRAALRTLWAYAGPGLLVSVGYMDPGNWCARLRGAGAAARARAPQSTRISEKRFTCPPAPPAAGAPTSPAAPPSATTCCSWSSCPTCAPPGGAAPLARSARAPSPALRPPLGSAPHARPAAQLMAMVLQALAVRLGAASSRDLAQACREQYPRWVARCLWVAAECAIAACDLAEVIGTAIALQILFGLPLPAGVIITAADVLVLLAVAGRSARGLESIIVALLAVICACFVFTLARASPPAKAVLGGFVPRGRIFSNGDELYLAAGILGATVMPHNLYLHSALVQSRSFAKDPAGRREAISYGILDSTTALIIAGFVNASILTVAAAAFAGTVGEVATLNEAASLLAPALGSRAASTVFAVGLLAAGQQSTLTGTLAGQVVMEGFLGPAVSLKPWARRMVTRLVAIVPAVAVAAAAGERGAARLLNFSQVVLSLQLPFAIFPLVHFTGSAAVVGEFATRMPMRVLAWAIFAAVSAINLKLVVDFASGSTHSAR